MTFWCNLISVLSLLRNLNVIARTPVVCLLNVTCMFRLYTDRISNRMVCCFSDYAARLGAALSIVPRQSVCPSVCPSIPCLRISRNRKATNLMETLHWTRVYMAANMWSKFVVICNF